MDAALGAPGAIMKLMNLASVSTPVGLNQLNYLGVLYSSPYHKIQTFSNLAECVMSLIASVSHSPINITFCSRPLLTSNFQLLDLHTKLELIRVACLFFCETCLSSSLNLSSSSADTERKRPHPISQARIVSHLLFELCRPSRSLTSAS